MANEHVAISTQGVQLLRGDSKTTLKELAWVSEYPDLSSAPDTIDVTTLMHTQQATIPALPKSDTMSFPCFMDSDAANYKAVQETAKTPAYYAVRSRSGWGWVWHGQHTVSVPGKGVDDAIAFNIDITSDGEFEFMDTITVSGD